VHGSRSRAIGWIVVGCCLASCCWGCHFPRARHGVILRGDWSVELNRVPWLTGRPSAQEICSPSAEECGPGVAIPAQIPTVPAEDASNAAGPEPVAYETPCPPGGCVGPFSGGLRRLCRKCGKPEPPAHAVVGYHNHPRFHPVPTCPVFSPRTDDPGVVTVESVSQPKPVAPAPPKEKPSSIKITPPAPVPEEIEAPRPVEPKQEDRVTRAPKRLETAGDSSSWIFDLPEPPEQKTPVAARSKSAELSIVR